MIVVVRSGKSKCGATVCRLVGGVAPLLILLKRWLFCSFFLSFNFSTVGRHRVTHNGLAVGEEADFEALNCLPALNLIRRTNLHLCTEPAFLPNACYMPFILSMRNYRSYKCSQCPNNSVSNNYFFVSQRVSKKNKKANVNR